MNSTQLLGLTVMGYAFAPTPDDVVYVFPPIGAIKDSFLFTLGLAIFLFGSKR